MNPDKHIRVGSSGYHGINIYDIPPDVISSISIMIVNKVNSLFGERKISSVSNDLITQIFETVRINHKHKVVSDDETNVLEQIKERVANIIAEDAIAFYAQKEANKSRSIWNTVGTYKPDNLRAINNKANLLNPTISDNGQPRF